MLAEDMLDDSEIDSEPSSEMFCCSSSPLSFSASLRTSRSDFRLAVVWVVGSAEFGGRLEVVVGSDF
jgi:hypothetical protein